MTDDKWTEPGRYVAENGAIRLNWPFEGRFAELWKRCDTTFSDEEKHDLLSMLMMWQD